MGNGCYSYGIVIHDRYMGYDICRFVCVIYIWKKNTNDVTSCYDMVKYAIYMV